MKKNVYWIEGDGVGPEIWRAARPVLDAAVFKTYGGERALDWVELAAGEKALREHGTALPPATLAAMRQAGEVLKGPLGAHPDSGGGDVNAFLRRELDLYARVRPARHYGGQACPVRRPELVNMVAFCSGCGEDFSRLARRALAHARARGLTGVTLVHDGGEAGADGPCSWERLLGAAPPGAGLSLESDPRPGTIVLKEREAADMFREVLLNPEAHDLIVAPGRAGLFLSEVLAAQVGGLGLAVEINLSDTLAVFETRLGPEPHLAGKDAANPGGLIICGALLLERLGWAEAAAAVLEAMQDVIESETFTIDLGAHVPGADVVGCAGFGQRVIQEL